MNTFGDSGSQTAPNAANNAIDTKMAKLFEAPEPTAEAVNNTDAVLLWFC